MCYIHVYVQFCILYVYVYVFAYTHIQYMYYININIYTYVEVSNHSEVPTRQPPGKPFKSSLSCKMKKRRSETEKIWNATTALNPFRSPHHSNHLYNKNKNPSQKSSNEKKKCSNPSKQFYEIFGGYQQKLHRNQTNRHPHRFHRGLGTIDFQLHQRGADHTTNLAEPKKAVGSEGEKPQRGRWWYVRSA